MEQDNAGLWQPISDFLSNTLFYFRQWQRQQHQADKIALALTIAALLIAYLLWRFFGARQRKEKPVISQSKHFAGLDSEFYLIEQKLQNTPDARMPNESMRQWVKRLDEPELTEIYRLHYRLRFDPEGINQQQRQTLRSGAIGWLAKFQQRKG